MSELIVSVEQDCEELPFGYIQKHRSSINQLAARLDILPEWLQGILDDGTTADLTVDDEDGLDSYCIQGEPDRFPASVYISAPELSEPERCEEVIQQITDEFSSLFIALPHLILSFQLPPDSQPRY